MSFRYLTNVSLDEAKEEYINTLRKKGFAAKEELVGVAGSCGRITSKAVYANICAPHYLASAMDGVAVSAKKTFGATETTPVVLSQEDYVIVDTGDPVPEGVDAVIMIEDVVNEDGGNVRLHAPATPWQHIRQIGEDICAGEMILPAKTKITPSAIGAMLAGGVTEVCVIKKPVVGIIPTGDEIVPPTSNPGEGEIIEFNSSIISGMLLEWGAESKIYPIVPDKYDLIKETVIKAASECDLVILNAGSSAGRDDNSTAILGSVGKVLYHGIAIKPGKPAILAYKDDKPLLGVPGYPVSAIIVIDNLLKPLIYEWYDLPDDTAVYEDAVLSKSVVSGLKYREFVRVRLGMVGGKMIASPLNRGAGVVSSFMKADGILEVPQGKEGFEAGETVRVKLLKPKEEIINTIVSIGSHDPLLDELSNMLHQKNPDMYLASSHVGSMGGIMALKRGETHIAGCHLLDENDGTYNTSYLKKHFPNGGVYQVECVGRTQGIMVAKGNPKSIKTIKDLTREGIRYVNRQRGSGTRILIDYLCKKEGIDFTDIEGYDREEFTHTSVAAQIAGGTADAGMGIYSAAKLYDLDFVPVCTEQYDLLVSESAWETPSVKELIEVLRSDTFKARLSEMGGYTLDHPGEVRAHF